MVIIHVIWTKKVVPIFCLFVRLFVRVITYGHINEKGENKHTIWLKHFLIKFFVPHFFTPLHIFFFFDDLFLSPPFLFQTFFDFSVFNIRA